MKRIPFQDKAFVTLSNSRCMPIQFTTTIRIIINAHTTLPATLDNISIHHVLSYFPLPTDISNGACRHQSVREGAVHDSSALSPSNACELSGGSLWDLWET